MCTKTVVYLVALALACGAGYGDETDTSGAEDLDESVRPKHCVSLTRIDRTEVVDDQNILFFMKGKQIYHNRLPHKCSGLSRRDTFMYRTSLNDLCNVDIITVLDDIGFGFSPGISCGLGMFYPTTQGQVAELKAQLKRRKQ